MKKLIYSTLALIPLIFASACDKMNTEPAEEPKLYVNTWVVKLQQDKRHRKGRVDGIQIECRWDGNNRRGLHRY